MKLNFSPGAVAAAYIVLTQGINLALLFGAALSQGQIAGIEAFYLAIGVAALRAVGFGYITEDEIKTDKIPEEPPAGPTIIEK